MSVKIRIGVAKIITSCLGRFSEKRKGTQIYTLLKNFNLNYFGQCCGLDDSIDKKIGQIDLCQICIAYALFEIICHIMTYDIKV
jgi:hypothetical protein